MAVTSGVSTGRSSRKIAPPPPSRQGNFQPPRTPVPSATPQPQAGGAGSPTPRPAPPPPTAPRGTPAAPERLRAGPVRPEYLAFPTRVVSGTPASVNGSPVVYMPTILRNPSLQGPARPVDISMYNGYVGPYRGMHPDVMNYNPLAGVIPAPTAREVDQVAPPAPMPVMASPGEAHAGLSPLSIQISLPKIDLGDTLARPPAPPFGGLVSPPYVSPAGGPASPGVASGGTPGVVPATTPGVAPGEAATEAPSPAPAKVPGVSPKRAYRVVAGTAPKAPARYRSITYPQPPATRAAAPSPAEVTTTPTTEPFVDNTGVDWERVTQFWRGTQEDFNRWWEEYKRDHGGREPWEGTMADPTETLLENIAALYWGQEFERAWGRPPNEKEYQRAWYTDRFGLGPYRGGGQTGGALGAGWGAAFADRWGPTGWGEPWYKPGGGGGGGWEPPPAYGGPQGQGR